MSCALIHISIGPFTFVTFCGRVDKGGLFNIGYREEDLRSGWELSSIPLKGKVVYGHITIYGDVQSRAGKNHIFAEIVLREIRYLKRNSETLLTSYCNVFSLLRRNRWDQETLVCYS